MKADICFRMGTSHQLCEDYISEKNNVIALSDGCSSSKNTDIGSRILVHSVLNLLDFYPLGGDECLSLKTFSNVCIYTASTIVNQLGIPIEALDCTLMLVVPDKNKIRISAFGDGYIVSKGTMTGETDDIISITKISFSHNAPYYLSYELSSTRNAQYLKDSAGDTATVETHRFFVRENSVLEPIDFTSTIKNCDSYFTINLDNSNKQYKFVLVSSDGLGSFIKKDNGEQVSYIDIVKQLSSFPNTNREFVKRRVSRMMKDFQKDNVFPTDDISVGVLYLGD